MVVFLTLELKIWARLRIIIGGVRLYAGPSRGVQLYLASERRFGQGYKYCFTGLLVDIGSEGKLWMGRGRYVARQEQWFSGNTILADLAWIVAYYVVENRNIIIIIITDQNSALPTNLRTYSLVESLNERVNRFILSHTLCLFLLTFRIKHECAFTLGEIRSSGKATTIPRLYQFRGGFWGFGYGGRRHKRRHSETSAQKQTCFWPLVQNLVVSSNENNDWYGKAQHI